MKKRLKEKKLTKKEQKEIERLKRRTLKESIKEGSLLSIMSGFGNKFIVPFAIILKATNFQIGLLTSFIGLVSPFSQLYGSKLMEKNTRKHILLKSTFFQALMWIPIILLVFLFWKKIAIGYLPWLLILSYLLLTLLGSIALPSWFSLMGDLVPENKRGRYFSIRNKITGAVLLISILIASFILDFFKTRGLLLVGFITLFLIAMVSRLKSISVFKKHYEPKLKLSKKYYFSIKDFLKKGLKTNFGIFVLFVALFNLTIMIASPFFAVYILEDLALNYKMFMLIMMSATFFSLIFVTILGKFSDKFGNRALLKISTIMISLSPILWVFSRNIYYLIFIPQFLAGIGWAGFVLATGNFIYETVSSEHRGLCIAYYNILVGIGIFIGALIGGLLTQYIKLSFMNTFLFVFLISGILRAFIGIVFIPKIKEVRQFKRKPHFHLNLLNPAPEIIHDIVWMKKGIEKVKKEVKNGVEDELIEFIYKK